MHILHNWSTLCMINMYNKLNMLIIVCYIYILNNIGSAKLVFRQKIKFKKKKCLFSINFYPFYEANYADQQSHFPYKSPEVVPWWVYKFCRTKRVREN